MLIIDDNSYHKENLDYLFSILAKKDEINCVLLGYFSKVVISFFQKNKRDIYAYFYSNDAHAQSFMQHLYSKSLVDPLKSFLVIYPDEHYQMHDDSMSESRGQGRQNNFSKYYQQRVKIFNSLFQLLEKADDFDTLSNVQFILETLVAKIDQTIDGMKLLESVILKDSNIKTLFNCLRSSHKQRRRGAADILNLIFSLLMNEAVEEPEKRNTLMAANGSTQNTSPEFSVMYMQKRKDEKNVLFQTFVDELEEVIGSISTRRAVERSFNNSIGKEVKVIDYSEVRILHLVQSALKFNLENINLIVAMSSYFDVFFEIFKNSGWNSSIHTLFIELIKTCIAMMGTSPILASKLSENNKLVKLLFDCTANDACYVDSNKVFRKAYCGAINEIGTYLTKLPADKKSQFCDNDVWRQFFDGYLKPIIEIERTDRDDVFRKSTKFDRPDYGSNIPFELFSALSNLHIAHKTQESESGYPQENQDLNNEDGQEEEKHEGDQGTHETEATEDGQRAPEPHEGEKNEQTKEHDKEATGVNLPTEFSMLLRHQHSIEEQVIETKQDNDLANEMEINKKENVHQPVEVPDASSPEHKKNAIDTATDDTKSDDTQSEGQPLESPKAD